MEIKLILLLVVISIPLVLGVPWFEDEVIFTPWLPIESNGAVPVNIQDQHTEIIDLEANVLINNITLDVNTVINDYNIIVTSVAVPTTDLTICLKEGNAFYQSKPTSVVSMGGNQYNLTMDSPLDYAFTTNVNGCLSSTNLVVDGSTTPVIFKVTPCGLDNNVSWDITRIMIIFGGEGIGAQNDAPDDADFGVTSALTKGIVFRSVNGITKNIFNAKTNGELRSRTYDVTYTPASKAGKYSVSSRRTFAGQEKNGVTVRLDAETCDEMQIIIQDDLTEMDRGILVVQGHAVTD